MPYPKKHKNAAACQAAYRARQQEARRLEQQRKGFPNLPSIPTIPGERRWAAMVREATALLQTVAEERESYYDDRSDEWQESDRGDDFRDRTDATQKALDALEEIDAA